MAEPKFEKDLEKLEAIVQALEAGDLSLDDSLARFEEGIRLARCCEKALTKAEKRIEILTKNAEGELEVQPFGDETEGETNPAPAPKKRVKAEPKDVAASKDAAASRDAAASGNADEGDSEEGELLF